ncbi:hypothetical protein CHARACLAT_023183 [Characodon lateralis]|uniref:Uncharacterized protein n=1 Tax=Characodon lateralis TaxID=208331 RepID=A0ABU7E4B3_9TELE|nr:hypothetical protein [Characodon lateralis]
MVLLCLTGQQTVLIQNLWRLYGAFRCFPAPTHLSKMAEFPHQHSVIQLCRGLVMSQSPDSGTLRRNASKSCRAVALQAWSDLEDDERDQNQQCRQAEGCH